MPVPIPVLGTVFYEQIKAVRTVSGNASVPRVLSPPEKAGLTTQLGVPIIYDAGTGYVKEASFAAPDIVLGVSLEPGHNLTASGAAQQGLSEVAAPNQPNSLTIPYGSWIRLGTLKANAADGLNIFSAAVKYTTLPNLAAGIAGVSQIFLPSMIQPGVCYALVKDNTTGFWYIDLTTTAGNAAVAQLVDPGVDPSSPNDGVNGARVFFQFKPSQRFFQ